MEKREKKLKVSVQNWGDKKTDYKKTNLYVEIGFPNTTCWIIAI
jgi:hypothetical protein